MTRKIWDVEKFSSFISIWPGNDLFTMSPVLHEPNKANVLVHSSSALISNLLFLFWPYLIIVFWCQHIPFWIKKKNYVSKWRDVLDLMTPFRGVPGLTYVGYVLRNWAFVFVGICHRGMRVTRAPNTKFKTQLAVEDTALLL